MFVIRTFDPAHRREEGAGAVALRANPAGKFARGLAPAPARRRSSSYYEQRPASRSRQTPAAKRPLFVSTKVRITNKRLGGLDRWCGRPRRGWSVPGLGDGAALLLLGRAV